MATTPAVLALAQILPYLPAALDGALSTVDSLMRLIAAARRDPSASEPESKAIHDALDARIAATVLVVEATVPPKRQP